MLWACLSCRFWGCLGTFKLNSTELLDLWLIKQPLKIEVPLKSLGSHKKAMFEGSVESDIGFKVNSVKKANAALL